MRKRKPRTPRTLDRPGKLETENHVKELVQDWFKARGAWHYAATQNGLGVHGIHDRVGCVPFLITQDMVGKAVGLLVSVESKAPGRRGEPRRGMSAHQQDHLVSINAAGGISICCDGVEDLALLDARCGPIPTITEQH